MPLRQFRLAFRGPTAVGRNRFRPRGVVLPHQKEVPMKGIIAWLLGVPLIVIIALYVFHIF